MSGQIYILINSYYQYVQSHKHSQCNKIPSINIALYMLSLKWNKNLYLPSAVGFSHNHTLQQWPDTSTNRGDRQAIVSRGGGKFSFGHNDEQAWRPSYMENNEMKVILWW